MTTERQIMSGEYETDAPIYLHKPPAECPNCAAPVWIETKGQTRNDGVSINLIFECGDSLGIANGRIWKQDGSASFPHGIGCQLARKRLDRITEATKLASAVEAMFAGECGREPVERMALAFLRGATQHATERGMG